jgi:hypothetical protein
MDAMATQMISVLRNFYRQFPSLRGRKLYIMGESYGGRYVPHLATAILASGDKTFNLQAVSIGDGSTDPVTQTSVISGEFNQCSVFCLQSLLALPVMLFVPHLATSVSQVS